ncbi:hypothetical protein NDU88_000045 [Pleurodeles waltl]|uniref:Uncharacterized protein n=1 Tax=Pleurodeles waltl TaxID=8319 RepID=A0AAV7UPE4_PLEWA|nr:hypothetical protein NDU88_000045 [Pleurodeles waltl]
MSTERTPDSWRRRRRDMRNAETKESQSEAKSKGEPVSNREEQVERRSQQCPGINMALPVDIITQLTLLLVDKNISTSYMSVPGS